ncbi:hypothetical protein TWF173_000629 [Orbilia oligospora]|nr:hypothetical protein TWF173_000629 [Orbilia oligospora]
MYRPFRQTQKNWNLLTKRLGFPLNFRTSKKYQDPVRIADNTTINQNLDTKSKALVTLYCSSSTPKARSGCETNPARIQGNRYRKVGTTTVKSNKFPVAEMGFPSGRLCSRAAKASSRSWLSLFLTCAPNATSEEGLLLESVDGVLNATSEEGLLLESVDGVLNATSEEGLLLESVDGVLNTASKEGLLLESVDGVFKATSEEALLLESVDGVAHVTRLVTITVYNSVSQLMSVQ